MDYSYDYSWIVQYAPALVRGLGITLAITVVGVTAGLAVGLLLAWLRTHDRAVMRLLIVGYVEVIRNTPYMIQLFFVFFGLPQIGVRIDALTAAFLATALNVTAYSSEIFRSGIEATPKGQIEAGLSLSLSRAQVFVHIVLPPALRMIWPALVSQVVIIMLGTAVVSQIAVEDLTFVASYIQSRNFRSFETYFFLLGVYFVLSVLLRGVLNRFGRRIFGGSASNA